MSRWFTLVFVVFSLAGCTSQTQLVEEDIYSTNLLFTVPAQSHYRLMNTGFSPVGQENSPGDVQQVIEAVLRFHHLTRVSQFTIQTLGVEAVVAKIAPRQQLAEVLQAVAADDRVQSVQSVRPYKLLAYNDPYYGLQSTVNGDRIEHIHESTTGKNVTVGIVDTGVDRLHPELAGRIVYTRNLVAHDQASFDLDEHGTAVAGVIGSAANNDLGIVGVAPDVKLMVFKACHQELLSRRTSCDSVSIIKAISDALDKHPDILNLSLSGPRDPLIEQLLQEASARGMVLVVAIDESRGKRGSFPAAMPEVIAVGTSLSRFREGDDVLLAPGTDMLTTAPGATYGFKSGSSMAAAYVSGIAALIKETLPDLTSPEIFRQLKSSSRLDENELPVVDMCMAVNAASSAAYRSCERARSMAVNVEAIEQTTGSNLELTN